MAKAQAEGNIRLVPSRGLPTADLVKHVLGVIRPRTGYTRKWLGVGVEVEGFDGPVDELKNRETREAFLADFEEAGELAVERDAAKKGGKPASLGMSMLFLGGPETNELHRDASTIPDDAPATLAEGRPWTLDDCRDYKRECVAMLKEAGPGMRFVASLHVDELRVHVHAEAVAMVEFEDGTYRIGNAPIREGLARLAPKFKEQNERARRAAIAREAKAVERDKAAEKAGKPVKRRRKFVDKGEDHVYLKPETQMKLVHDAYAERMKHFGLVRGKGGRKRHWERVDRDKGMQAKLDAMERDAREEREREEERSDLKVICAQAQEVLAKARVDALELDELEARVRRDEVREEVETQEARRGEAHERWVTAEREASNLDRRNKAAAKELTEALAEKAQAEAEKRALRDAIEAGTRGALGQRSKRGKQLVAERDQANRERDEIKARASVAIEAAKLARDAAIQSAAADKAAAAETRVWRTAMRMPHQGAVASFSPDKLHDIVQHRLESARAEGVRELWAKLRTAAGEKGAAYLASLASLVGPLFGERGPAASRPPLRSDRDRGAGIG